jgi:Tol biopolymer transport system component
VTRNPRATKPRVSPRQSGAARPPATRDPYGLLPTGTPIAAILSAVGLVVVIFVSLALFQGQLPLGGGGQGNGNGQPGQTDDPTVIKTPTPSGVVVVPTPEAPGIVVPGSVVYAKDGNIWIQADGQARQLTDSGNDSMPSFNEDGTAVYFVRTRAATGQWPVEGVVRNYEMDVPALMRVGVDGIDAERVFDGLVDPPGSLKWMGFIQSPVVSPDGTTIAMTSDLPDPSQSDVTLKLLNLRNSRITDPGLDQRPPLGHQDPAWHPSGERVAYVRNDRDGAKGTPRIYVYTPETERTRAITGPGYLHPSWSPDGRFLAVTRTTSFGTDVVIIDAATGGELVQVTNDGDSWGPVWSPAGNQLAYLHVSGQVVDLRMVQLDGAARAWTVSDPIDLTSNAGLDSVSTPDWFVPADQMPDPTPPPSVDPTEAPSAS